MYKLGLEKAEEPKIKFSTSVESYKKKRERERENSRKISTSVSLTIAKAFDCVDHHKLENS